MHNYLKNHLKIKIDSFTCRKRYIHLIIFAMKQEQNTMTDSDLFKGGTLLPLMEEFYSLQGEGFNTGLASYFIRIGGCDIGCSWCDSKRSWQADRHPLVEVNDIISRVLETPSRALLVTGGEPSLYDLKYLTEQAKSNGLELFIETSGAYKLTGKWDWICLSPKKQNPPLTEFYNKADELKVIIHEPDDFIWAEEVASQVHEDCQLFLQPEWSRKDEMTKEIIRYIKKNPDWRISMQTHKVWGIP